MDAATTNHRPGSLTPDESAIYDWLEANGITEYLPEDAEIHVDARAGTITYTSLVWNDGVERGFNANFVMTCDDGLSARVWRIARKAGLHPAGSNEDAHVITEMRTVPLRAPLTDRVRELLAVSSLRLKEPGK